MSQLQRVTTEYVATEDRIKMTGELGPDETVLLWLNQRLLLRLLPHLFAWLEEQGGHNIPSEIIQSFAQQAATAELGTEPSVQRTASAQEWLVSEIDITPDTDSFVLRFKGNATQEAVLPFSSEQLRQWLSILYTLWGVAEWPMALWPQWLRSDTDEEPTTNSTKHYH